VHRVCQEVDKEVPVEAAHHAILLHHRVHDQWEDRKVACLEVEQEVDQREVRDSPGALVQVDNSLNIRTIHAIYRKAAHPEVHKCRRLLHKFRVVSEVKVSHRAFKFKVRSL